MNIGLVTVWAQRGAGIVSLNFAKVLSKQHTIFIFSRGGDNGLVSLESNYKVKNSSKANLPITSYIDKDEFVLWIKENSIDCILFNEQHWFEPLLWCRELNVKTIAYIDYYKEDTIELYGLYDTLICNTRRHYDVFSWHPGANYVRWGVDTSIFNINDADENSKADFFHSCGMSPHRKGTDLLLKACTLIDKKFQLIIHTQVSLHEFYRDSPKILKILEELEKDGKLKVIEGNFDAPGLYHLGRYYVYPCRLDGLGLTVTEALACGLPSVIPDFEPMTEFSSLYCKRIKIKKLYARNDGYYWPCHEIDIDDLSAILSELLGSAIKTFPSEVSMHVKNNFDLASNLLVLNSIVENTVRFDELFGRTVSIYNNYMNTGYNKIYRMLNKYRNLSAVFIRVFKWIF